LFLAYKPAVELFKHNYDLLLADCTYKTNRYNMPLLHFIAQTPISHFSVAFSFQSDETEPSYLRSCEAFDELIFQDQLGEQLMEVLLTDNEDALKNAAEEVWPEVPQLLCIWHVNKNVLTKAQEVWSVKGTEAEKACNQTLRDKFMASWSKVLYSTTEEIFKTNWEQFVAKYQASQPELIAYMEENQYPQITESVKCFTSEWRHFGVTSTSIVEQSHGQLKRYLPNSRGDLLTLFKTSKFEQTSKCGTTRL
jgi:hypothetical protein